MDLSPIMVRIQRTQNDRAPSAFLVVGESVTIGRQGDIRMDTMQGKEISRIHAVITRTVDHKHVYWTITDCDSLNGTFVDGRKIRKHVLKNGEVITFGVGPDFSYGDYAYVEFSETRYTFLLPPPVVELFDTNELERVMYTEENAEECPICCNPVVSYRRLPCHHMICLSCMRKWEQISTLKGTPFVCPICRTSLEHELVGKQDILFHKGVIKVYSLESTLRRAGFKSVDELMEGNIFRLWTGDKKQKMLDTIQAFRNHPLHMEVFRYFIGATPSKVQQANTAEILVVVQNLDGKTTLYGESLRNEALSLIVRKFHTNNTKKQMIASCTIDESAKVNVVNV